MAQTRLRGDPLRVLVVTQYFWPENFRINDLVAELAQRGHQVTVLTGLPNYPEGQVFPEFARKPGDFDRYAEVPIVRIPVLPRGRGSFRLVLNYLSFVISGVTVAPWRLRNQRFDAIFMFQISPITAALPGLLLRRSKRAPLLLWVLDLWPQTLSAVGAVRSRRILTLVGRMVSFIYRRCDRILVQSRAFVPLVEMYAADPARIKYFPGWAEPTFHGTLDGVEPAPEVQPYKNTFNILFAGNIGSAQDFPAILDAAEALRDRSDVRWLIVGDGRAAEDVRAEIRRRNLEQRVVMLGRFPVERMPSFFRAASALLVTLKKDPIFSLTIPGKVQAYLAAGVPILGMLDGEGARVIEEADAGLVCPAGRSGELSGLVRRMIEMPPQERAAMGERGRDYCQREFGRATLVDTLETWMREVAQERGRRG